MKSFDENDLYFDICFKKYNEYMRGFCRIFEVPENLPEFKKLWKTKKIKVNCDDDFEFCFY